jgi:hypothetical protein
MVSITAGEYVCIVDVVSVDTHQNLQDALQSPTPESDRDERAYGPARNIKFPTRTPEHVQKL